MASIEPFDPQQFVFDIRPDLTVTARERLPGPPVRVAGATLGFVAMSASAPHGGEVHPDGDEILLVLSGRVSVCGDSAPDEPLVLGSGQACIVRAGEWHKVDVLEPTQLIHVTPDPNGDHRPL